jgi:hypothetical protein
MIKDHHEGHIGWAEYQPNLKGLALNNYGRAGDVKSDRVGKALLLGAVRAAATREIRRPIGGTSQTL